MLYKNPYLDEETNIRNYSEDGDHQQAKECARKWTKASWCDREW